MNLSLVSMFFHWPCCSDWILNEQDDKKHHLIPGKEALRKFTIGQKYQIFLRSKVSKNFFTPNHSMTDVFFFLTKSKVINDEDQGPAPITGKSFLKWALDEENLLYLQAQACICEIPCISTWRVWCTIHKSSCSRDSNPRWEAQTLPRCYLPPNDEVENGNE